MRWKTLIIVKKKKKMLIKFKTFPISMSVLTRITKIKIQKASSYLYNNDYTCVNGVNGKCIKYVKNEEKSKI